MPDTPTQHTPGPWHVTEDGFIVAADGRRVGYMHGNPRDVFAEAARVKADRALQAAAPDLLSAVVALLDLHIAHHNNPEHVAARAAIAKATTL
jgi:hypothetical protein